MEGNQEIQVSSLTVAQLANMLSTQSADLKSQITSQVAQQVSDQVAKAVGQLQSDLASRTIIKSDTDVGMDERIRSTGAREDAMVGYKTNVTDFVIGTNAAQNQGAMHSALQRMIESSVNHYTTTLSDERVAKDRTAYFVAAKQSQELRHTDIATENQWESTQESANDALAVEMVKSTQVLPASTE